MGKQTEAYYQRVFEDAPIGMYKLTLDGKILEANNTLVNMLGYPDLEFFKKVNIVDLFVDPNKSQELISLHLNTDKINLFEFQMKRRDGSVLFVRDASSLIKDENGRNLYFVGVLEDISERVQAERELQKSRNRIETERAQRLLAVTLRDIANLITGTLEFDELIQKIFKNLERLIPFDSGALILCQDEKLHIAAGHNIPNIKALKSLEIHISKDSISRQIIETRQPLILNNPTQNQYFKNYGANNAVKSWLGIPLIARNTAIGLLTLDSTTPNVYKEREMQIALTLASQIAVAIENARLFSEERRRADIMSALQATFTDITSELDLTTLLQAILKRAVELLNSTGGEFALHNSTDDTISIVVCHKMEQDYTGKKLKPGSGAIGRVVQSGEPILIDDYSAWDGHFDARPWKAVMVIPLEARDRILGAIALADSTEHRKFSQDDMQLISLFAQQAAIAIENAQLFELISSTLANTKTLYQTAQSLIATENLVDLLQNLVEQVANTLPADQVILITLACETEEITNYVIGGHQSHQITPVGYQELMDGLTGWVMQNRKPALSHHSEPDPREKRYVQQSREKNQTGSLIVVPLRYRQEILGTLTAINSTGNDYTQTEVDLLETIASHAAVAIKNAQLFEDVQKLAETDELTKTNNRRQLFYLGRRAFNHARRYSQPLSVIMLDIDDFKAINDSFGHAIGDVVLYELAQYCESNIREVDILGRYGGEEFVIVLPNTDSVQCSELAERLCDFVELNPIPTRFGNLNITISLGVAQLTAGTPNLAALIDQADTALYNAKEKGKNRVETYRKPKEK